MKDAFERFHKMNPHVMDLLKIVSLQAKEAGMPYWSIAAAFGVVRFMAITTSGDQFKMRNDFMPFYARRLMEIEPALKGFFRTKEMPVNGGFAE